MEAAVPAKRKRTFLTPEGGWRPLGLDPKKTLEAHLERLSKAEEDKRALFDSFATDMPEDPDNLLSSARSTWQVEIAFTCQCDETYKAQISSYDSHLLSDQHKKYVEVRVGRYGAI